MDGVASGLGVAPEACGYLVGVLAPGTRQQGVKPRTLLPKKTTHDPHAFPALLDAAIVLSEPSPYLFGDVPRSVVPDEQQNLLADLFELFQAPSEKLSGYGTEGPAVDETQPRLPGDLGQIEPVAGDGLRLGIIFFERLLKGG